jgi:hypothetical protein
VRDEEDRERGSPDLKAAIAEREITNPHEQPRLAAQRVRDWLGEGEK